MSATEPRRIGDYDVVGPLGGGSMGVVFRARHVRSGRLVALKTVHVADPHQLSNLRAEIVALARLAHPGVVSVLDHGSHEGAPYLVTELVEGMSLADQLARFATSPDLEGRRRLDGDALALLMGIFVRLARALAYVHGEGIVHRDLKPGNVVVRPDGRPVLIDFGLARLRPSGTRESLDAQRGAVGTALYMSPEQIGGQLVDARADLYALGVMIHRAISGEVPFLGEDVSSVLAKHLIEPPPVLSRLVSGAPPELDALVLGLLEKDRRIRVPYALDVVETLVALGADAPEEPGAPRPRPYVYGSALLGRAEPQKRAQAALAEFDLGRGATLVVTGESGVGKTRFVVEVTESLSYGYLLAVGECDAAAGLDATTAVGGRPLDGLRPLLRRAAEHAREHPERARTILGDDAHLLALYEPDLLPFVEIGSGAPLPSPAGTQERLVDAVLGVARRLSAERPLVIVLDDIQWADVVTKTWARAVAGGALHDARVAVILSARIENAPDLPLGPGAIAIHLAPLDGAAMSEIANQMLGSPGADRAVLGELVRAAQGNPFALASAIRTAAEEGSLVREGRGRWRVAADANVLERLHQAGTSVAATMARVRLLAVSADALALAAGLAVLGGAASLDDATFVALRGDPARGATALGELLRRGVAEAARDGNVALAHDKLREAAYATLSDAERATLHRSAAARLEATRPATAETWSAIAHHLVMGGDGRGAVLAYLAASDGFEGRGASNEALHHAETAAALAAHLAPGEAARRRASVRLGGLLVGLGAVPRARALLEEARASAEAEGDLAVLAAAQVHLSYASYLQGELESMFAHARAGAATAARVGDQRLASRAENALGIAWGSSGKFRLAITHYQRAKDLASELGDAVQIGRFLSNISINHRLLGELEEAERCARGALDLTRAAPTTHANAWSNLGRVLLEAGRHEEAGPAFERAFAIATRTHSAIVGAEATWGLALTSLAAGDGAGAALRVEQSLAIAREGGMDTAEALGLRALGWVQALSDPGPEGLARARDSLDRSVAMLAEMPERDELAEALRARAYVRARAGDREGAEADVAAARAIFAELEMAGRLRALAVPMEAWTCF